MGQPATKPIYHNNENPAILRFMGIWDRLGSVIKSYLNDDAKPIMNESRRSRHDSDYDAAYEELEDFLRGEKSDSRDARSRQKEQGDSYAKKQQVPFELKMDFAELGLEPGATETECKEAYKKLLKIHHPDRHSGDPEKMKKATEKTSRINAAYDRLQKWFKLNK